MKLRNFMYATMIACAFASCSKDDVNGPDSPDTKADATLSVKFNIVTKSTAVENKTDETISNLRVYVFNGDDTYQTQLDADGANVKEVKNIPVVPGTAKVVAVANFTETYQPASVSALYDYIKIWNSEKDGSLTMNSQTYNVSIVGGVTNYLGYTAEEAEEGNNLNNEGGQPVKMYRNVAKVKLASIKVGANTTQYPDASFKIEDVFILHGSVATKLVGGAAKWAATYVATTSNAWVNAAGYDYSAWVDAMAGKDKIQNFVTGGVFTPESSYVGSDLPASAIESSPVQNVDSFYVYENPKVGENDINTLLVVKGKFLYTGATEANVPSTYYSVAVGKESMSGAISAPAGATDRATDMTGVLRNLQYNIALTVKTPGYETPFGPKVDDKNTALDVKVEVMAWGQVDQFPEI